MTEEDLKNLGGCWEGRVVELESLTDEDITGVFEIVEKRKVSVDSLSGRVLQTLLYRGNSRIIEVKLEGVNKDEEYTIIVNQSLDDQNMEAAVKSSAD